MTIGQPNSRKGYHVAECVMRCVLLIGKISNLASPIEVVGWPKAEWGDRKYYRIRLLLFEDPDSDCHYCATLEGTPDLFSELDEVLETKGGVELRKTLEVGRCSVL